VVGADGDLSVPEISGAQQLSDKARDSQAKSDVRNAVTRMESCFRADELYTGCPDGQSPLSPGVTATVTADGALYVVSTVSRTGTFSIERLSNGFLRSCTAPDTGGCGSDSSW